MQMIYIGIWMKILGPKNWYNKSTKKVMQMVLYYQKALYSSTIVRKVLNQGYL